MKKIIFLLLITLVTTTTFAQQKEWSELLSLLKNEAIFFEGKKGFVDTGRSEYNTFLIKEIRVNDTLILNGYLLQDSFGKEEHELYLEEIVMLKPNPKLVNAEILYEYPYYFHQSTEANFLLMEFDTAQPMIHQVNVTLKNIKKGTDNKTAIESETVQILLPVRVKNYEKIMAAIWAYQSKNTNMTPSDTALAGLQQHQDELSCIENRESRKVGFSSREPEQAYQTGDKGSYQPVMLAHTKIIQLVTVKKETTNPLSRRAATLL